MPQSSQRRTKRATIKDVAEMAGVSVSTVSNALNGRTEAMTGDTLTRIQEAIQSLNYRPNQVARSLVTNQTATVGLIIAEIETPLFLQALNIIEPVARGADYNVLVCSASDLEEEQQAVNLLLEKQVDGIIFLSLSRYLDDDYLNYLPPSIPPIVMINRTTVFERFDNIHWDNSGGIVEAVDYLVQAGHRRIAHLRGPIGRHSSTERLAGYKLGLQKHHLDYREDYVRLGDYEVPPEAWRQSTLDLLSASPRPTAILAPNDTVAAIAMKTIQQAGLRVPQDVSVIGYDDQPFCIYLNPALTTVKLPILEAGQLAMEILLTRLSKPDRAIEHIQLPCSLVIRESSGVYVKEGAS